MGKERNILQVYTYCAAILSSVIATQLPQQQPQWHMDLCVSALPLLLLPFLQYLAAP